MLSLAIALTLGSTVSAAAKERTVQVFLNGQAIVFQASPKIFDSRTFVEFRTLFERLGYEITYVEQSKTINATSSLHDIQMSLDGDVAFVDGEAVPKDGQMRIVNDRTFVGLRFVTELSGLEIEWDAESYTATIVDNRPTGEQQAAVFALLDRLVAAEAASDAEAFASQYDADTPHKGAIETSMKEQMKKVKTTKTILSKRIGSYFPEQVVLLTKEETKKVSGGFHADYVMDVRYTLRLDADGYWKIFEQEMLSIEYIGVEELFGQAATVPESEIEAIRKTIDDQLQATNSENIEAYISTMSLANDAEKEQLQQVLEQTFTTIDTVTVVEKWAVMEFNGSGRATVLISLMTDSTVEGTTVKSRVVIANEMLKKDGKWLFFGMARQLSAVTTE